MIRKTMVLACAGVMALASGYASAQAVGGTPSLASSQQVGPFAVQRQTIRGTGFGGATVFVPVGVGGTSPSVVLCPGFTASQTTIQVQAQRIASYGFVVATIDTNSRFDLPPSRGTQLAAGVRALAAAGGAAGAAANDAIVAVGGHSMGGGGTFFALLNNAGFRAGVAFAPFATTGSAGFTNIRGKTITTIVGTADDIAPEGTHSIPFFNRTTANNDARLCRVSGEDHFFVQENPVDQPSSRLAVATYQVALRGDARWLPILNDPTGCLELRQ